MGTSVTVDASLAFKWTFVEPYQAEARALLAAWKLQQLELLVPALFVSEISAAVLRRRRRDQLQHEEAVAVLRETLSHVSVVPYDVTVAERALEIADGLQLWKAYDSLYLALAEHVGCELWTGDERFFNAAGSAFPFLRWIGTPPSA